MKPILYPNMPNSEPLVKSALISKDLTSATLKKVGDLPTAPNKKAAFNKKVGIQKRSEARIKGAVRPKTTGNPKGHGLKMKVDNKGAVNLQKVSAKKSLAEELVDMNKSISAFFAEAMERM